MQPWLIQRIIREILPYVIDGVRAQMRSRRAAQAHAGPGYGEPEPVTAAPGAADPGIAALRRELDERLRELSEESEARFAAVQSQLRILEDRLMEAHAEQQRRLQQTLFYTRMLLGWSLALTVAVLYLLLS